MISAKNAKYYIALFIAIFIWSSSFLVAKVALTEFKPITLAAVRILIAFFALLPVALKRGFHFRYLFTKTALVYGIFGYGGNLVFLGLGLVTCTANVSAIIHGLFPFFMVVLGYYVLNESVTMNKILSIILSVAGVFIASVGDLSQHSSTTVLGIVFVVISVLVWAYYSVYSKKTGEGMDAFVMSEVCFGAGFLCVLPFAVIELLVTGITVPGPDAVFSLLYLSVMSAGLGTVLWNYSLKRIDSTRAGIYFNLMPVIGLVLAYFAHERIAFLQIAGSVLVLAGVLVCMRPENKNVTKS